MLPALRFVWSNEEGAVTVDWVVLTAAILTLTLVLISLLYPSLFLDAADKINNAVQQALDYS
ncbi:hypothetical protein D0Z66_01350 [Cereibacter sphaeroides]|uniref:Pilus assembly protein n=1 Tax=Cereibacter azotoformans TaxID=43057 RepID=A0A2T5KEN5_9RHOB|nr:hypothetical protein D0Z66_01350 [Cereibacter sphaeroides]PTR20898.1 hypothetical protein C8J28_101218 [Cereibacter azotoformans]